MAKYRDTTTHVCGKPTHGCVTAGQVWKFLKDRHPQHTDKNTAQELSAATGENISYRTVERWRRRLPSGRHIILLFITFPDLIRHLKSSAEQRQANYDALARRHEKLQAQGNDGNGTREDRCDNDRESSGD